MPFPWSRGAGAQRLTALLSRGGLLSGWSTLRITRPRFCDQTFWWLGPTVLFFLNWDIIVLQCVLVSTVQRSGVPCALQQVLISYLFHTY